MPTNPYHFLISMLRTTSPLRLQDSLVLQLVELNLYFPSKSFIFHWFESIQSQFFHDAPLLGGDLQSAAKLFCRLIHQQQTLGEGLLSTVVGIDLPIDLDSWVVESAVDVVWC